MRLVWIGGAWLAGIALGSAATLPIAFWFAAATGGCLLPLVANTRRWRQPWAALIIVLALGGLHSRIAHLPPGADHISQLNDTDEWIVLRGTVVSDPDHRETYTGLRVAVDELRSFPGRALAPGGIVLVHASRFQPWSYGDRVEVGGYLETPPIFEGFSYRDYLARQGIHTLISRGRVRLMGSGGGHPWLRSIYALRQTALRTIQQLFPEPEASLLAGILLGIESGIEVGVREAFNQTGTTHVIAISGFNITLIAALLIAIFARWLGAGWGSIMALLGIAFYTILVGAQPSVVRAALMGSLALLAQRIGRQSQALASLSASAILMTAIRPHSLWDVGFQLSFSATLGLVLYAPGILAWAERQAQRWFSVADSRRIAGPLSEFALYTLAAQLTTLPLVLLYFQRLSLSSLLANPVILPVQPMLMGLGGLAVIAGMIWLPLGRLAAAAAWLPTAFTIRAVEFFASLPLASIPLERPSPLLVASCYFLLAAVSFSPRIRNLLRAAAARIAQRGMLLLGLLAVLCVLIWKLVAQRADGRLHLTILDVGAGEAILVETPAGRYVLLGGGGSTLKLAEALGRRLPLLERRLDWVIVASSAEEHLGGLVGAAERFAIGGLILACPATGEAHQKLLSEVSAAGIPIETPVTLDLGAGARLEFHGLGSHGAIVEVRHGHFRFLIPAGADPQLLRAGWSEKGGISGMLLADGGNLAVNPETWLNAVDPRLAVVSLERASRRGLPSIEVLEVLGDRQLLRTDRHGWIEIATDGIQLWVQTEHR